jgi:hypothetical protein
MLYEPLLAHQIARERVKDTLREAKQIHLGRVVKGPKKSQTWRLPIASVFRSLLALFAQRKVGY